MTKLARPRIAMLRSKPVVVNLNTARPLVAGATRTGKRSSTAAGYGYRWQQARLQHLRNEPLCRTCRAEGRVTAGEHVDHIRPHRGDQELFWDRSNWQTLCATHHSEKTALEDGGFGREPLGGR